MGAVEEAAEGLTRWQVGTVEVSLARRSQLRQRCGDSSALSALVEVVVVWGGLISI